MAVELGSIPASTRKQSISMVRLDTNAKLAAADRKLEIYFEDADYDAQGNLVSQPIANTRLVSRRFGDIAGDSITAAGATVTVAQLAALIQTAAYIYRAADVAAAQPQS